MPYKPGILITLNPATYSGTGPLSYVVQSDDGTTLATVSVPEKTAEPGVFYLSPTAFAADLVAQQLPGGTPFVAYDTVAYSATGVPVTDGFIGWDGSVEADPSGGLTAPEVAQQITASVTQALTGMAVTPQGLPVGPSGGLKVDPASISGNGPVPVTVQVTDAASGLPVQSASVQAVLNGQAVGLSTTDTTGATVPALGLNVGQYQVAVTAGGYSGVAPTFNVSGAGQVLAVQLVKLAAPPATTPGTVIGTVKATDGSGRPLAGAVFTFRLVADATGDQVSGSAQPFASDPTDPTGRAYPEFVPGWTYRGRPGPVVANATGQWVTFVAPSTPFDVPTIN